VPGSTTGQEATVLTTSQIHRIALACAIGCALMGPASATAAPRQDLRSPDARDAAGASSLKQDLRSPDARDAAADQPPVNAPGATAVDSASRPAPAPAPVPTGGDGMDWAPIGLGLAGALFGIAGLGVLAVRRTRRVRVPA
jgi:hypothetical protein